MRILIIDSDSKQGFMILTKLTQLLHNVDWAINVDEAEAFIAIDSYDIYVMDWIMPGKSGLEICTELRKKNDLTAILMLTAYDEVNDRINGLMSGVDDFLIKPFVFEELYARIFALDRRKHGISYQNEYTFGCLKLNPLTQIVTREGMSIYLTKREFQLLAYFMRHAGVLLTRDQILNNVWGNGSIVTLNAVDSTIKLLRKKLDFPLSQEFIINVHGRGYRLVLIGEHNV